MVHPWHLLDGDHFLVWVIGAKLLHLQDIIGPLEFFRIDKKQRLLDTVLVSVIAHWEHPRIEGNATPAKNNIWILSQVESFVRTFSACFGLQQNGETDDTEQVNALMNHFVAIMFSTLGEED